MSGSHVPNNLRIKVETRQRWKPFAIDSFCAPLVEIDKGGDGE